MTKTPRTDSCQGSDGSNPDFDEMAMLCRELEAELAKTRAFCAKCLVCDGKGWVPLNGPPVKLYAFQPFTQGSYSFFVAATSEEEARRAVGAYIGLHKYKDDGHFIGINNEWDWEKKTQSL